MQPGLYVVRRTIGLKSHVGLLAVNNLPLVGGRPLGVLIHFNTAGLHRDVVYDLSGWKVERRIKENDGEVGARLKLMLESNQQYALLNNNCEHLVSFVETGERKSPQVQGWVAAAVIVGSIFALSKSA